MMTTTRNWLQTGYVKALQSGQQILVSRTIRVATIDPLSFFAKAQKLCSTAFFWQRPVDNFALVGAGAAYTIQAEGLDRFETAQAAWQKLVDNNVWQNEADTTDQWGLGPTLMGGFAFEETTPQWKNFGAGRLMLPQIQLASRIDGCYITFNVLLEANSRVQSLEELYSRLTQPFEPSQAVGKCESHDVLSAKVWQNLVKQATDEIKAGSFEKVVLAREVQLRANRPLEIIGALEKLRAGYPTATIFAIAQAGQCFLGATPERLVQLHEGEVRTIGLAGSAPRGQTTESDREYGLGLMNSLKNRGEHAIVVDMLQSVLKNFCSYVWADSTPQLLKLANVQHLYTPVIGRIAKPTTSILKLVEALHPTPALGGYPRQSALAWLKAHENLNRGWYAAPVGWLDQKSDGEFVVAIRSALVNGNDATLFAGCGIVADSEPESEYSESCLKLKPLLKALDF